MRDTYKSTIQQIFDVCMRGLKANFPDFGRKIQGK